MRTAWIQIWNKKSIDHWHYAQQTACWVAAVAGIPANVACHNANVWVGGIHEDVFALQVRNTGECCAVGLGREIGSTEYCSGAVWLIPDAVTGERLDEDAAGNKGSTCTRYFSACTKPTPTQVSRPLGTH